METRATEPLAGYLQEMPGEYRDVVLPIPQRRHLDRKDAEPVVEIFAEPSRTDQAFEIAISRRNNADVDPPRRVIADRFKLAVLQHPQQLGLHRQRQLAYFIEK